MTRNAVIDGTYSDFKLVKTRSVFQMVIEGPIERAAEAIAMFGVPQPGQEIHVAVARLQEPAKGETPRETRVEQAGSARTNDTKNNGASERGRDRYLMSDDGEKAVIRAGILCKDARFQEWIAAGDSMPSDRERYAAMKLRYLVGGIESRRELASNERAYNAFRNLEFSYHGHAEIRS